MLITVKKTFYSKTFLKIISLIIAYSIWSIVSKDSILNKTVKVPIYLYNINNQYKIETPKELSIQLTSFRKNISKIDFKNLAIFINAKNYNQPGLHPLIIDSKDLFLPENIKVSIIDPAKINFIKVL